LHPSQAGLPAAGDLILRMAGESIALRPSLRRVASFCKHLCHVFLPDCASIGDYRHLMCGPATPAA
jgi:hypothetical protein